MAWNNIECFAMKNGLLSQKTLRFIHLGYPLLRVRANINFYKDSSDFCLLKKFILELVGSDANNPTVRVKDRLEAFRLLGLDNELYDVASYYYDQLILEGLIHDTPQGVLAGPAPADDPAFQRIRSARAIGTHLTVDPFGALICGKNISELHCLSTDEIREKMGGDIYLPILPAYVSQADRLELMINHRNFDFSKCTEESRNEQLRQQNMPPATQGIQLIREDGDPVVEVYWLPCYVALERTDTGMGFTVYRPGDGKPISDRIPIHDAYHKPLQKFLLDMFKTRSKFSVVYKLSASLTIPIRKEDGSLAANVTADKQGNYLVTLKNEQLIALGREAENDAMEAMMTILEGCGVIGSREPGRLVRFNLTSDQQTACQNLLKRLRAKAAAE